MNRNALITVVLCLVVFVFGFALGNMTAGTPADFVESSQVGNILDGTSDTGANTQGGTTIDESNLTQEQRNMLESFGIDPSSITITPEMIACAEAELGAARLEEIRNGAMPSVTEGAALLACYR